MNPIGGPTAGAGKAGLLWGVVGVATLGLAWEILGRSQALGNTFPPPSDVIAVLTDHAHRALFRRAVAATGSSAARGFAIGTAVALLLAVIGAVLPVLKEGMDRFVASIHAVPLIALGPLFVVLLSRAGTPTAIACLASFFPVYVACAAGLDDTSESHRDLFSALGTRRWTRLRHLQLPAALPAFSDGLRLAAPAAVLGAVLGEWFGAPRGIGILIVSSMQNFQIEQLWASAMLAALISLLAFALFGGLERFVVARTR